MGLFSLLIMAFGGHSQGFSRPADPRVGMGHPCKRYLIYALYEIASKAENMEAWHKRPTAAIVQTKSLLGDPNNGARCAAREIHSHY